MALIAGGAIGITGLVYYFLRRKQTRRDKPVVPIAAETKEDAKKLDPSTATKEEVLSVLSCVIESQDIMKALMKDLIQMLLENDYGFQEVYQKVKAVQPDDPLEATGLTMHEFDELLTKYQKDPEITQTVARIMGMSACSTEGTSKAQALRREKIIEIHKFMLQEIKKLVEEFQRIPEAASYDMKTVTIAVQAIVGSLVEKKYSVGSDEIELAVILHHQSLASNAEFARINVEMQSTISSLMGTQFPGPLA